MKAATAERVLVVLMRVMGVFILLALPAALMPYDWMNAVHRQARLGDLPKAPIVEYLTRSCSLLYAMHGALLLFLSRRVRAHLAVIQFLAVLGLVFGAAMLVLDLAVNMPWHWTLGEGPFIVLESILFLYLCRRMAPAAPRRDAEEPG